MKIVVPFTQRHEIVEKVLVNLYGLSPRFYELKDDYDYWKLLCGLWAEGEKFVIVEHDILPWPGAIEEIYHCPLEWCSCSYKMAKGYGIHHAFGCTKFGSRFIERMPNVWTNIRDPIWRNLDAQLCEIAKIEGVTPHPHRPPVIHLKGIL